VFVNQATRFLPVCIYFMLRLVFHFIGTTFGNRAIISDLNEILFGNKAPRSRDITRPFLKRDGKPVPIVKLTSCPQH